MRDPNLERYIDGYIASLLAQKESALRKEEDSDALNRERFDLEHRRNQRRFEYDYEEDLYEPLYEEEP